MPTRRRDDPKRRNERGRSARRSAIAAALALPVAVALVLGAGPGIASAAPPKTESVLCKFLKKAKKKKKRIKECVNSADIKDDDLISRHVRKDASQFKVTLIDNTPVGPAAVEVGRVSLRQFSGGVITVTATVNLSSASDGSLLCVLVPTGTGAAQGNQVMFGSVDPPVLKTSMFASRGFEVKGGRFSVRLICTRQSGSGLSINGFLGLQYAAERH